MAVTADYLVATTTADTYCFSTFSSGGRGGGYGFFKFIIKSLSDFIRFDK